MHRLHNFNHFFAFNIFYTLVINNIINIHIKELFIEGDLVVDVV